MIIIMMIMIIITGSFIMSSSTSLAHGSSVSGPLIGAGPKRLLNSASEIAPNTIT